MSYNDIKRRKRKEKVRKKLRNEKMDRKRRERLTNDSKFRYITFGRPQCCLECRNWCLRDTGGWWRPEDEAVMHAACGNENGPFSQQPDLDNGDDWY